MCLGDAKILRMRQVPWLGIGILPSGVSRVGLKGVSERRKCKWPVIVGASNGVTPLIKTNHGRGGGVPGNQKTPLDTPLLPKCAFNASRYHVGINSKAGYGRLNSPTPFWNPVSLRLYCYFSLKCYLFILSPGNH